MFQRGDNQEFLSKSDAFSGVKIVFLLFFLTLRRKNCPRKAILVQVTHAD